MDYETLKDQWSDVEERDGIRLSWNTFPSSRMVREHRLSTSNPLLTPHRKPRDLSFQLALSMPL